MEWSPEQMPSMDNQVVVITGASQGIGFEAARLFCIQGAHVYLAVRSRERGERAMAMILQECPQAKMTLISLDLSDLERVHACAESLKGVTIDILLNNAGVMLPPLQKTRQGWELQIGCNHLGHFALTGHLLPQIRGTSGRIVTVSSIASKRAQQHLRNMDASQGYVGYTFYCRSKWMNYLFGRALDQKLKQRQTNIKSIICHPGIANTNLMSRGTGDPSPRIFKWMFRLVGQTALAGAYPLLYASTVPTLQGGEMVGPDGAGGRKGRPFVDASFTRLWNESLANELWAWSEQATGITYENRVTGPIE